MEFALTPYDTSKEILTIKANNYEEWEEKTADLPFAEYEVVELGDYSWIRAEQGDMQSFFEACERFEEGVATGRYDDPGILRELIQQLISSNPRPAYILDINWFDVQIIEREELIEQISDDYEIEKIGFLKGYIDWNSVLLDLKMGDTYSTFDYGHHTYYVRGL
jgi:hypothetical protein